MSNVVKRNFSDVKSFIDIIKGKCRRKRRTDRYSVFHRFGQAKFANGGSIFLMIYFDRLIHYLIQYFFTILSSKNFFYCHSCLNKWSLLEKWSNSAWKWIILLPRLNLWNSLYLKYKTDIKRFFDKKEDKNDKNEMEDGWITIVERFELSDEDELEMLVKKIGWIQSGPLLLMKGPFQRYFLFRTYLSYCTPFWQIKCFFP